MDLCISHRHGRADSDLCSGASGQAPARSPREDHVPYNTWQAGGKHLASGRNDRKGCKRPTGTSTVSCRPMISVVDDDAFVRQATENLLLSLGFAVVTFASAEAFLDSGQIDDTSCLIADVQMPGLTGLDLQRRLVEDGKRLPIIFITAFFSDNVKKRALEAGAVALLNKPFGDDALIEYLHKALYG